MTYCTSIETIPACQFTFSRDLIEHFDTSRVASATKAVVTSVDLSRVIATTHRDYAGSTWGDLKPRASGSRVAPMKRQGANLSHLRQNPHYYLGESEKEHWSFLRLGDDYIIESGNHRTVYGRFFLAANDLANVVHGVSVWDITLIETQRNDNEQRERRARQSWML